MLLLRTKGFFCSSKRLSTVLARKSIHMLANKSPRFQSASGYGTLNFLSSKTTLVPGASYWPPTSVQSILHVGFCNTYYCTAIQKNKQTPTASRNVHLVDKPNENIEAGERVHRFIAWLGGYYTRKAVLSRSSSRMYKSCIDSVKTEDFIEALDLPNTFQSWFIVTHLHLWFCLVRLKREGEDGNFIITELVTIFWENVRQRMRKLGVRSSRVESRNITEFHHAFNGLLVAYEEGLLNDDMMLASALWRNMFHDKSKSDPVQLARMVEYIRKQVHHMDNLDSKQLLESGYVELLPL